MGIHEYFRRSLWPTKKKTKKNKKNLKIPLGKGEKHLKAPIFGFHVIVFGGVLLEALSSPWNLTNRYSKQPNIWRKCIFVQCHHLRYLLIKFRRCKVDSILEGVLDVFHKKCKMYFFLKTFDDWDMIPIGFFCGLAFFFVMPQTLCENVFTSPETNISPWKKTAYPKKESTTYPPFFKC